MPSGRFVLRIAPRLHARLRAEAEKAGVSLNAHCAGRLESPAAQSFGPGGVVLGRSTEVLDSTPLGVVAFGSWARGDATEDSDLDVLVVVGEQTAIDRSLYRRWDAEPLAWEGRRVDAHFSHLPHAGAAISALWADVALEGIVLFDPDLAISRTLLALRRRIMEGGELIRREVHGQPYWVGAG
ncbi:MAG: toxin-antitoxin system HicB family antitoxin [Gemmatimonadota bacterium]